MAGTKKESIGHMTKGSYIIVDGVACRVVDTATSRPGKHGHAKVNMFAVGLIDGRKRNLVLPGHDMVDVPIIEKKNAQVLSVTAKKANLMDAETYETFDLEIPDELMSEVKDGVTILYWEILDQRVMKQIVSEDSKGGKPSDY
jgi:translation initiation factor 5A